MREPDLGSGRYTAATPLGGQAGGRVLGRRYLGEDAKLRRRVVLHAFDTTEGDVERQRLLELAKRASRLRYSGYLQVLDVVLSPDQVMVVLEAPFDAPDDVQAGKQPDLPALVAIALVLQVGAALEDAAAHDLTVTRVPNDALYLDGGDDVRIDPIALFADTHDEVGAGGTTSAVTVLCDFLESLLADRSSRSRGFDPGAQAASSLLARWRERSAAHTDTDLPAFLGELRLIPAANAGRPGAPGPDGQDNGARASAVTSSHMSAQAEPTLELPLGAAAMSPEQHTQYEPIAASQTRRSPGPVATGRGLRRGRLLVASLFGMVLLALALGVFFLQRPNGGAATAVTADASPTAAPKPPANRASLTVAARQSSQVRVTVDGASAFSGVLQPNESRSWDGAQRVQLWTNNGKNLLVTVNGYTLGPLSSAVGHPDWNTVDWGWSTGWTPAQSALDTSPGPSQPTEGAPGKKNKDDNDD